MTWVFVSLFLKTPANFTCNLDLVLQIGVILNMHVSTDALEKSQNTIQCGMLTCMEISISYF